MSARILDGRAVAERLRGRVAAEATRFTARHGRAPGLATVLVGDDPASRVYVRSKRRLAGEVGLVDFHHSLDADTSEAALRAVVTRLNENELVDAILIQLPLPPHIDAQSLIGLLDPAKDVDGFHPLNVGRLASGSPKLVPCTPRGCMMLIAEAGAPIAGKRAVVLGRSAIVGRPMAALLLAADATVTVAHSRSANLADVCREADILVAAVGRAEMVRGDWIKPGATAIDVGINRLADGRLVGDIAFDEALRAAGALTPVPGGVGPMTIACLLDNSLIAANSRMAPRA